MQSRGLPGVMHKRADPRSVPSRHADRRHLHCLRSLLGAARHIVVSGIARDISIAYFMSKKTRLALICAIAHYRVRVGHTARP
jgi:hypothetical protein